ncbi:hypothetical protein [Stetteria hydrogenophila]
MQGRPGIPRWVKGVRVEYRPGGGVAAAGRRGRTLWLAVPASPSRLLEDGDALAEAVEAASEAWLNPLTSGSASLAASILLGALGLVLLAAAPEGALGALAAALISASLAIAQGSRFTFKGRARGKPGAQPRRAGWVEPLVKATAALAASREGRHGYRGTYPLMGEVFEYTVETTGGAVLVSMRRRKPY